MLLTCPVTECGDCSAVPPALPWRCAARRQNEAKSFESSSKRSFLRKTESVIKMRRAALLGGDVPLGASEQPSDSAGELTAAIDYKRRGAETKLVLPGLAQHHQASRCDPALIKAIARGRAWFEELATGRARSLQELANRDGIARRYIRRLIDLSLLEPAAGRNNPARAATRRAHRDASDRTRSAAELGRAAQPARELNCAFAPRCAGRG